MLYLALPHTPPPIIATLAPTEVRSEAMLTKTSPNNQRFKASTQNNNTARVEQKKLSICRITAVRFSQ